MPSRLVDKLKRPGGEPPRNQYREPLWTGPNGPGPNGGVTQGLLARYISCGERFRVRVMEGLRPPDRFLHTIEFGLMWHVCEEALASGQALQVGGADHWQYMLMQYCKELCRQYPLQQEEVDKWYNICLRQFPLYVKFWQEHSDVKQRTPILQEKKFDVSYRLPSGRPVRLRGKWDSVDFIKSDRESGLWLMENKTKGEIDEEAIRRQLNWDLQVMFYLIALDESPVPIRDMSQDEPERRYSTDEVDGLFKKYPILGVRYNVIRRPLSGGKGTIKRKEPTKSNPQGESKADYYARLAAYIKEEPQTYFMRWQAHILPQDVTRFRRECLDPLLENLVDDHEWWRYCMEQRNAMPSLTPFDYQHRGKLFPHHRSRSYRRPYGTWSVLEEGGVADVDHFLDTGSEVGLQRTEVLFPELV